MKETAKPRLVDLLHRMLDGTRKTALLGVVLMGTTACGGGGGAGGGSPAVGTASPPATGGAVTGSPPVTSSAATDDVIFGRITGFGSVYVDGKRFGTDEAAFSKDDRSASQSDLRVGMMVEIRGSLDAGSATTVRFEEDIRGPVDAVTVGELTVLGQRVLLAADTVFDDGLRPADVLPGDVLEISGLRDASDALAASFLQRKVPDAVTAFKVIGAVRDLDTTARTFRIGGLTVDYGAAEVDDRFTLANDQLVEVKDTARAYTPGELRLLASKVEPAGVGRNADGTFLATRTRAEGLIGEVVDAATFTLGGITVRHDAQTLFRFGDASRLAAGTKVQVEGSRREDGGIDARVIKFSHNAARIDGVVEGVDSVARTVTMLGVRIVVGAGTRLEDKRDDVRNLALDDLLPGDFLEVRGASTDDVVFATELRRDEADDTRVRGPVSDVDGAARTLSILGVRIVTDAGTQYRAHDDSSLTATAFFSALAEGQTLVDAKWRGEVTDATVAVRELSLEE
ncbi:MAG: hypothetical protein H6994_04795 [Pseudomonadales bacterium]|nr:hypothetical protein [Pseudomonadales bacterium]